MVLQRHAISVRGLVQGVGFRPFVHGLACRLGLDGFVKNCAGIVRIEVEGSSDALIQFKRELREHPPPLARVEDIDWTAIAPASERGFRIAPSDHDDSTQLLVSPDVATCDDCLRELFDPGDRRFHYPFLNCTHCGPRLTIIQGAPYDRERTTMASFAMCPACQREFDDPSNRRFHAQPTACPECGPALAALRPDGTTLQGDPLRAFVDAVLGGSIGTLKGLGGFHLVCDARNSQAVSELRRRKHRDEKPFALMVRDVEFARALCLVDATEGELLQSRQRPIVLLRKRPARADVVSDAAKVADLVSPGNSHLGIMLPYTPLHHLLMEAVGGVPLVMTSGNRADEPIVHQDRDIMPRLGDIADVILSHNRPIRVRCDDSVVRVVDGKASFVRRSRGYAPEPITLPQSCPCPLLAVGGQFKNVFALGTDRHAFLSHHVGDLDHLDAYQAFERDIHLYEELFEIEPAAIIHDLHPNYASTGYALRRAAETGMQLLGVQHHHAHMASCMAENGVDEPVIGVCFDGTGHGTDGAIWGGEFLVGDHTGFTRAVHLRYVRLPGGDQAIREPWRMAVAHALDAGCDPACVPETDARSRRTLEQMIARGLNAPWTSSAGRLFDAVAALVGLRSHVSYEGQAAMELEWQACQVPEDGNYPFEISENVDIRPMVRALVDDVHRKTAAATIARRFHSTMVEIIVAVCTRIRSQTKLDAVVLSGGVFLNALLSSEVSARLYAEGFRVFRHQKVPPGDGGLSLGQLAIAAKKLGSLGVETAETGHGESECASAFQAR